MTSYWKLRTRPEMAKGQSLAADAITRPLSIEEAERVRAERMTATAADLLATPDLYHRTPEPDGSNG